MSAEGGSGDGVLVVLVVLVAAGADVVENGALHTAALLGKLEVLMIMVKAGADVSRVYEDGVGTARRKERLLAHSANAGIPFGKTAREYYDDHCDIGRDQPERVRKIQEILGPRRALEKGYN